MTTQLKLYNTLTRTKVDFKPIDANNVRMYVCGPTVYDFAHIGNARPVIVFDVLYRLLRHVYGENHVNYVRNITDVDDKINARALRDFPDLPLNEAIRKVTEKTANQFHEDVKALGCLEPTHEPRATDYVLPREDGRADMVTIIQRLLDGEHAYVAHGTEGKEVLFAVNSMVDSNGDVEYGKLSGRKLEDQQAGARISVEEHKRNAGDFVLWKESGSKMPGWKGDFIPESKAGFEADFVITEKNRKQLQANSRNITIFGRPGWHIECSAMSDALLWDAVKDNLSEEGLAHPHQFDIHGGGLDLIFPHHENEIAQSRCAHGTDVMANVWMHNGFLQVEGKKMSKSDGNFFTIAQLLATSDFGNQKWDGTVLRLAMLMTHYRQPIDFSESRLIESKITLGNWLGLNSKRGNPEKGMPLTGVLLALADDLDFSSAKLCIDKTIVEIKRGSYDPQNGVRMADPKKEKLRDDLAATLVFLGLAAVEDFPQSQSGQIAAALAGGGGISATLTARHTDLINERLAFLAAKNFTEADRIRDELLAQGIQLKDGKDPVTGERVTTWEVKR